jgi:hypothetical protein
VRVYREPLDNERRTVGKTRNKLQPSAHRLNVVSKRRKQHVAPALEARNRVLTHAEALRKFHLRMREGFAHVLERGCEFARAPLDLRTALGG